MFGLDDYMFAADSFVNVEEKGDIIGYQVELGIPFYRALPISCIEEFDLVLDGAPVKPESAKLLFKGHELPVSKLSEYYDIWWCSKDKPVLFISQAGGLEKGSHEMEGKMKMRWPILMPASWENDEVPMHDMCMSKAAFTIE